MSDRCLELFRQIANVRTNRTFLGRGTYGSVYSLSERERTWPRPTSGRIAPRPKCAVKIFKSFDASVIREVFFLNLLRSTRLVPQLIEVSSSAFHPYILIEQFDSNLEDELQNTPDLIREAFEVMIKVLVLMAEMTPYPCIHRDIKAANLLVTGRRVVVSDFGIARQIPLGIGVFNPREVSLTIGMQPLVTSSPEVLFRAEDYGSPVDVWSIGSMICYKFNTLFNSLGRIKDTGVMQREFLRYFGLPSKPSKLRDHVLRTHREGSMVLDNNISPLIFDGLTEYEKQIASLCMVVDPEARPTARKLAEYFRIPIPSLPVFHPAPLDVSSLIGPELWQECVGEIFNLHRYGFVAVEYFRQALPFLVMSSDPLARARQLVWLSRASVGLNCLFTSDPDIELIRLIPDVPERLGDFIQQIWDLFHALNFELRTWTIADRIYWCRSAEVPSQMLLSAGCMDVRWRNSALHAEVTSDVLTYANSIREDLPCRIPPLRLRSLREGIMFASDLSGGTSGDC